MTEHYKLSPEQDVEVESLVDKAGISYDEARRMLGYSAFTVNQNSTTTPVNISPRAATAPDASDHSKLGQYPNDPTYIR
jgi:hypothetical protein